MRPPVPAGELEGAINSAFRSGVLDLSGLPLGRLPDGVLVLRELRELRLADCELTALPGWLGNLRLLHRLDLSGNPIRELPSSMERLDLLLDLSLARTQLDEVGAALRSMRALKTLSLQGTKLTTLPWWIGELDQLGTLDLGGTGIARLPSALSEMKWLTHLWLWGHAFENVPEAIQGMSRLEVLDLGHREAPALAASEDRGEDRLGTSRDRDGKGPLDDAHSRGRLSSLPTWLYDLPHLRVLRASGQQIARVPRLSPSLEQLWLGGNELSTIPAWVSEQSQLRVLDLHRNRISHLPGGLRDLTQLGYLDLRHNRIALPPEVLEAVREPRRIVDFVVPAGGEGQRLDEAKLLIVGEGSVGKTSLIRRLVADSFSKHEPRTEGIEVHRWSVDAGGIPTVLNVWDFGGQEIMHATHQFFLTKRSLYVLVIDARQDEEQNRIEYWLKLIDSFGDGSPVVIVGNKTEQSPLDLDERGLRTKYPNVIDVLAVSCRTRAGIDELHDRLASAVTQLPHVRDLLPTAFFDVKRELERLDEDYIAYSDYERICARHGVADATACESLIGFLHDLGTVLCFREDPRLLDTNILNPEWVTGGVYRLLNSLVAAQHKGLLTLTEIGSILDAGGYPRERRAFIVDVMKRFELCFESDTTFLIPDLLVKQEPDTGSWDGALTFQVKFDVLPTSVISRLIVRMHAMISRGTVWRSGVVLALDGNRAFVKADREDAVVHIAVDGPASGRRGLLTAIRTELRAIAQTIPGLVGQERVPVPGHDGVFVSYAHLLDLEAAGHETVVPEPLVESFRIRDLLAGVELPGTRAGAFAEPPATAVERDEASVAEARPWSADDARSFGRFLLGASIAFVAIFVVANLAIGLAAAGAIASALVVMALLAAIVLRASGRLSESAFADAFRQALGRYPRDPPG
jgi:small GTP-binding protein